MRVGSWWKHDLIDLDMCFIMIWEMDLIEFMMIWDMFFLDVFGHFGPFEVSFFFVWLWMLLSQDGQTFVLLSGRPRETWPLSLFGFSVLPHWIFQTLDTEHQRGRCCFESLHMSVAPRMHLNKLPSLGDGEKRSKFYPIWEENLKDFHCLLVHICTPWGLKIPSSWESLSYQFCLRLRMRVTARGLQYLIFKRIFLDLPPPVTVAIEGL